ncbi:hypothetical protein [Cypionkella sp.]|uniref:AbiU2 domain-containing protein n=1 Tax=Cypionkella sp. TaxID=2811411 RepID=UPI002638E665|nr:hypothetical protein [Cypionkella sp.]MDB5664137.1 hypothetical protein [Cypionkella sp.]
MHNNENWQNYVDRMGEEYGSLFYHCYQDICHLRLKWRYYVSLFGTNKERFDLLYSVSEVFAYSLDRIFYDATLLGIRRLTDPAKSGKHQNRNISIRGFKPIFDGTPHAIEFDNILNTALSSAVIAQNLANKKIAHSDMDVKEGKTKIQSISRLETAKAIDDIAHVIKWVARKQMNTSVSTIPNTNPEDEIWFLQHLFEGKKAIAQKEVDYMDLMKSGNYNARESLYKYPEWLTENSIRLSDVLD